MDTVNSSSIVCNFMWTKGPSVHVPLVSVFSQGDGDLGRATAVKHRIDTTNHRPFRQVLRRQPNVYLDAIDAHVDEMMQRGLIDSSHSEWASNVVMVKKGDGSLRFSVDYRQLNERTRKDSYPLPRIDVCLDALAGLRSFSRLTCARTTISWRWSPATQIRPPL